MIPLLIAGEWENGPTPLEVLAPHDGKVVGRTSYASADQVERAVAAADVARSAAAALPLHARAETLLG